MLNYLGLWRGPQECYADTITKEDFALLQEVINDFFKEMIETVQGFFNSRFPFANIDLSYQFEISPILEKEETISETEDNEDIELDNNSDDDI